MFRVTSNEILEMLFKKAINYCNGKTKCVSTIVKLMTKKFYWVSYNIDSVKGIFGLHGSFRFNKSSVQNFISQNLEDIHGAMQQLMI